MTSYLRHLPLSRPLCALDCETTGITPQHDRIIEIAVVKFGPKLKRTRFVRRVDPGIPIPPSATAVHGLSDQDMAGCLTFAPIAPSLIRFLRNADLVGFNLIRFDLPLLLAEFRRAGVEFNLSDRKVIEVQRLYHAREPRDLSAAVRYYLGRDHEGAHGAIADVRATVAVLDRMLVSYPDLPRSVTELHSCLQDADLGNRLRRVDGRFVFGFGKYAGCALDEVAHDDPSYLAWLLGQDFLPDFKDLVAQALAEADG